MTDSEKEILNTLKAALTDRLHLDPIKNPVGLRFEKNAIVMEGVVEGIAVKKKALLLAMRTEGVEGVVDRLRVRPASAMTDAEIRDHLLRAFAEEPTISGAAISPEVAGGVVDIEGRVPSLTHKRLAGVLAWWVPGVRDVINSLEVDPPEEDSEAEIKDALRIVLEKDRIVNAGEVGIIVRSWTVTLEGVVRSEAEKKAAEEDAWYIWGVNDVTNNISVG